MQIDFEGVLKEIEFSFLELNRNYEKTAKKGLYGLFVKAILNNGYYLLFCFCLS